MRKQKHDLRHVFFIMVHQVRLELAWDCPHAPQTCASTYSATGA